MALVLDGGSNTITNLVINSANITDGSIVNADINSSAAIASSKISGSLGKILQVEQTRVVTTSSTASSSFSDTSLVRTITPSSASNKILCLVDMQIGGTNPSSSVFKLVRFDNNGTGTNLAYSTTSTNQPGFFQTYMHGSGAGRGMYGLISVGLHTLDSAVNAAEHSYRVQWRVAQGTGYLNRTGYSTSQNDYSGTGCSCITLMEIAA